MRRALAVIAALGLVPLALCAPANAIEGTQVCRFSDSRLTEISGLTRSRAHPGILWTHNDSSGGPYIYAVDEHTCRTKARIRIEGIAARDIEAIASSRDRKGRAVLWVADIGDNVDSWPEVRLHKVREPLVLRDQSVGGKTYPFTYSDRPHNAEALLVDPVSDQMWIVTKQLAHGRVYELPRKLSTAHRNVAHPVQQVGGLVTDAAFSPDGGRYVLRDYVDANLYAGRPPGRGPTTFSLPFQLQGEAVTWTADGSALLIASERDNRLMRVPVPR